MSDKLVAVRGPASGTEFTMDRDVVTVGSAPDCAVQLEDDNIAPEYARIEKENGSWWLRTSDVTRPIESDGRLLTELRLHHGAVFRIGHTHLRFVTPRAVLEAVRDTGVPFEDKESAVRELRETRDRLLSEVGKIIVGQKACILQILTALFARGHCLLIGAPGLAKTLLVRTLAGTLDLDARRVQFTPDLMPADITGTDILEEDISTGRRTFRFNRGPLFTNMLLADEINRTPPKTQAALLEAMQEQRVTTAGFSYDLPQPFLVLATQNPIELEGTYPLPEAQLDRFMFCINVDYPGHDEEPEILMETTRDRTWEVERVMNAQRILAFQQLVRQVPISEHVARYASNLIRATRPGGETAPEFVNRWLRWGAGPRAGQFMLLAAKAHVLLDGRSNVSCEDVRRYAMPVMRHRIFRNFAAASEGVDPDEIVRRVMEQVPEPEY